MVPIRILFRKAPADYLLATEEVITRAVGLNISPPTLRVNVFDPPAVLVGYSQDVYEEVNLEEAVKLGFHVNRRPTGGGAILMYEDTPGWEIWLPASMLSTIGVEQMYVELSKIPLTALEYLGVKGAKLRGKNDIEVHGRKISGTGLYMDSGGVLFCGTMLLDFNAKLMLKLLKLPVEKISDKDIKVFEERLITLKEILGFKPAVKDVLEAFKKAVREVLNASVIEGDLNEWEVKELQSVIEKYRSHEWIYGLRFTLDKSFTKICKYKTPAGLLRIHLKLFENTVEQVIITGDFFSYPQNALNELEAQLKWIHVDDIPHYVLKFDSSVKIPGLTLRELADLIKKCVESSG